MKFFVTYQMPHSGLDEWMKKPEVERKAEEVTMQTAWSTWMAAHANVVTETAGVGRPKRVTASGIEDARNDVMMYSFMEAQSLEAAAEMFRGHPHFGIPGGWIEVMPTNSNIS